MSKKQSSVLNVLLAIIAITLVIIATSCVVFLYNVFFYGDDRAHSYYSNVVAPWSTSRDGRFEYKNGDFIINARSLVFAEIYQNLEGPGEISTKINSAVSNSSSDFEEAGLRMSNIRGYIHFRVWANNSGKLVKIGVYKKTELSDSGVEVRKFDLPENISQIWLKLKKTGKQIVASYSLNAKEWSDIETSIDIGENVDAGIYLYGGSGGTGNFSSLILKK